MTAKGVQAVHLPTLASVPTPHFEGAQAPSHQEYPVVKISFQWSLPIKGACIAPATFDKPFEFIVVSASIANFQLIASLFFESKSWGSTCSSNHIFLRFWWRSSCFTKYQPPNHKKLSARRYVPFLQWSSPQVDCWFKFWGRTICSNNYCFCQSRINLFQRQIKLIAKSASDALHSEGAQTVWTISSIELHVPASK